MLYIRNMESESSSDELQWPEKQQVKLDTVINSVLFCCTKGLILSNTTQELLQTLYALSSVLGSGVSSVQSDCKNILRG